VAGIMAMVVRPGLTAHARIMPRRRAGVLSFEFPNRGALVV